MFIIINITSFRFFNSSLMALLRLTASHDPGTLIELLDNDEWRPFDDGVSDVHGGVIDICIGGGGGGISPSPGDVGPRCTSTVTVLVSILRETKQMSATLLSAESDGWLWDCWRDIWCGTRFGSLFELFVMLTRMLLRDWAPCWFWWWSSTVISVDWRCCCCCFGGCNRWMSGTIVLFMMVPVSESLIMVVLVLLFVLSDTFGCRKDSGTTGGSTWWRRRSFRRSSSFWRSQLRARLSPNLNDDMHKLVTSKNAKDV